MGLYFGTDGLRGKVNEDLTFEIGYKIGNALATLKNEPFIIIGSDTRISNSYLALAVASGSMSAGAKVLDIGVIPTPGVAYLTKFLNADYGVVISASHNSGEYNGIKIFNSNGFKLNEKEEEKIERLFIHNKVNDFPHIGQYEQNFNLIKKYKDFLVSCSKNKLNGLTIVLDCAHGAAHKIAPEIFRNLGAKVIASNCTNEGLKINDKCGALYPKNLANKVLRYKADMGFAFDGDSDRLIAVDEKGNIIDGDIILYGLAKFLKEKNKLNQNIVVGTSHTNMAIEENLKKENIELIRTDIGDKYVLLKLLERNLSIGGEQSGHIIIKEFSTTGDGILSAIICANLVKEKKVKFSEAFQINLFPQTNKSIIVSDKFKIMNSEELKNKILEYNKELNNKGRLMIRTSGTEPKIRIMVESKNADLNNKIADKIEEFIKKTDRGF